MVGAGSTPARVRFYVTVYRGVDPPNANIR